jgi:hypothetical protein
MSALPRRLDRKDAQGEEVLFIRCAGSKVRR